MGTTPNDMPGTLLECRATILVKALPQPSKTHGETVCCAGVTADGKWKRLFPVRFRHLSGDNSFRRWDWVKFEHTRPTHDKRAESCRVHEESIVVDGKLPKSEHARFLEPLVLPSINAAIAKDHSLALIRPRNTRFYHRHKSLANIQAERDAFERAARQTSLFDKELAALEPTPFEFRFKFEDDVKHDFANGDWEAHAMFYNAVKRMKMTHTEALEWMDDKFNREFPEKGMLLAVGNQAKRPHVWQLLGVLRVGDTGQGSLF
jgi:hypothetical protein